MIPFENTDLKVVGWEYNDDEQILLFILLPKKASEVFNSDDFIRQLSTLENSSLSEEIKDEKYEVLLEQYEILEIFEQEEISELTEKGEIDPEDIHQSLYEFLKEELNN
jgi:hypothetical protein